jgi:hypothetical protein
MTADLLFSTPGATSAMAAFQSCSWQWQKRQRFSSCGPCARDRKFRAFKIPFLGMGYPVIQQCVSMPAHTEPRLCKGQRPSRYKLTGLPACWSCQRVRQAE